jgi:hypothetical protein
MTTFAPSQPGTTTKSRTTSTGILLLAGGVLALIGNLLHPRFYESDQVLIYRSVNLSGSRLIWADVILILAVLLVTAGLIGLSHELATGGAASLSELGRTAAVIGGGVAVVQYAVDAYALRQAARIFALADDHNRVGAFYATAAVDRINTAMFSTWTLLLLGVTPLLLAAAMWIERSYPKRLAIAGGAGAIGCLVTAVFDLVKEDQSTLMFLFLVGSLLVTGWLIATGWLMTRSIRGVEPQQPQDATATPSDAAARALGAPAS